MSGKLYSGFAAAVLAGMSTAAFAAPSAASPAPSAASPATSTSEVSIKAPKPPTASPASTASPAPSPSVKAPEPTVKIAITVDDLPSHGDDLPGVTRLEIGNQFIAAFKHHGIEHVYGFINGAKVGKRPETFAVLKAWVDAGHFLGNHTWSHSAYEFTSSSEFIQDITANEKILSSLLPEKEYKWFRFPFLSEGNTPEKRKTARRFLTEKNYQNAPVTMDFQDWRWVEPYERCLNSKNQVKIDELKSMYLVSARRRLRLAKVSAKLLFDREIPQVLLLHLNGFTALMLEPLLATLKEEGAAFIDFKDAMQDRALRSDPGVAWPVGKDLLSSLIEARKLSYPPHTPLPVTELEVMCR